MFRYDPNKRAFIMGLLLMVAIGSADAQQAGVRSHVGGNDQWSAEAYKADVEAAKYRKQSNSASSPGSVTQLQHISRKERKQEALASGGSASLKQMEINQKIFISTLDDLNWLIGKDSVRIRETLRQHDFQMLEYQTNEYLLKLLTLRNRLDSLHKGQTIINLGLKEIDRIQAILLLAQFKNGKYDQAFWAHRYGFRNYSLDPVDSAGFFTDPLIIGPNRFFHFRRPVNEKHWKSDNLQEIDFAMADAAYAEALAKKGQLPWALQMATEMHRFYLPRIKETSWYDFSVGYAFYKSGNKDSGLALLTRAARFDTFSHYSVVKELGRMMIDEGMDPLNTPAFNTIVNMQSDFRSRNEIPFIRKQYLDHSGNYQLLLEEVLNKRKQQFENDSSYFVDTYSIQALWKQELRLRYKLGQRNEVVGMIQTALGYVEKKNQQYLNQKEADFQKFKKEMSRFDLNAYPEYKRRSDEKMHEMNMHGAHEGNAHAIFCTLVHQFMFDENAWDLIRELLESRKDLFEDYTEVEAHMYGLAEGNPAVRYLDWIRLIEEKAGIKMKFAKKARKF